MPHGQLLDGSSAWESEQNNQHSDEEEAYADGVARLQRVMALLEAAVEQQRRQQHSEDEGRASSSAATQHGQQGAEWEHHASIPRLLPPASDYPSTCGSLVSVTQLPRPGAWTPAWSACARGLQTLDLLLLHRQWLQWCAVKLPRLQMLRARPESEPVRLELEDLYGRYTQFTEHVMRLAPEAWQESVYYDLDSLQPLQLTRDVISSRLISFWRANYPETLHTVERICAVFKQQANALRAERARLLARATARAALLPPSPAAASGAGAAARQAGGHAEAAGSEAEAEELLLLQIEENITRHEEQQRECVRAVFGAIPAEQVMESKVLMYPSAVNGHLICF